MIGAFRLVMGRATLVSILSISKSTLWLDSAVRMQQCREFGDVLFSILFGGKVTSVCHFGE